jgi:hypothetical protein
MARRTLRQRLAQWVGGNPLTEAPAGGGGGGSKRDPFATLVKKIGLALDVGQSREFQAPEFDLTQITNAYDTESYIRQAIDKYIEMMFKAGWDFVGKNQAAVDYIRMRFKLIAEMTEIPTDQLFVEIAEDLVKYSNVTVLKSRDKGNLLGGTKTGINVQGLGGQPPVVGYFPANVTTMSVLRDKFGTVKGWQQEVEGSDKPVKYKSTDVVHIYYKREKGKAFGTPFLLSVLDDARSLRQAEETVLRLIYRNLYPFLHIQVGSDEIPGQQTEVDTVQDEFENMDLEAGFVTSERVKINAVAADKIIDAEKYLKYFEQRLFTGLGVSELMMGRGNTANRSTGDNLSNEFTDRVKALQKILAIFVDEFMVKELLMEGGFDPVLNPDDDVDFVFKEIDVDAKIKAENHAVFLYEHNAIDEDEMRARIGEDPITDRALMHMNLVTIPVAAANKAEPAASGSKDANNRNKPTNQHGTKPSPKAKESTKFKERYMTQTERVMERSHEEILKLVASSEGITPEALSEKIRETEEELVQVYYDHLGQDHGKAFSLHLHRFCRNLHDEVGESVSELRGSQKDERLLETLGGVFEVFRLQLESLSERAYSSYVTPGLPESNKEVE